MNWRSENRLGGRQPVLLGAQTVSMDTGNRVAVELAVAAQLLGQHAFFLAAPGVGVAGN